MLSLQSYGNGALKLYENGYIPIPIKPLTKRPIISDWPNIKNDYNYIQNLSSKYPHAGVGVLLNDLIAFDIDILDETLSLLVKKIITNELEDTIERIANFQRELFFTEELVKNLENNPLRFSTLQRVKPN